MLPSVYTLSLRKLSRVFSSTIARASTVQRTLLFVIGEAVAFQNRPNLLRVTVKCDAGDAVSGVWWVVTPRFVVPVALLNRP